jgi:hypothetical protein
MIIHSFLTDGFYDWAELFLKSFKQQYNNEEYLIYFDSKGLSNTQIVNLKNVYSKLTIKNEDYDWNHISEYLGLSINEIKIIKNNIEAGNRITPENVIWKLYIAAEQRFTKYVPSIMKEHKYILHLDIDTYFVNKITPLFDMIYDNDITLTIREKDAAIGVMGLNVNNRVNKFFDEWSNEMFKLDIKKRPRAYGQTSFYNVYKRMINDLKWCNIPLNMINKSVEEDKLIWYGSRITKKDALKEYKEDFKQYDH